MLLVSHYPWESERTNRSREVWYLANTIWIEMAKSNNPGQPASKLDKY